MGTVNFSDSQNQIYLSEYLSDLNIVINEDKTSAQPLSKDGFAFMWAGCMANCGVKNGKFFYEVKILDHLNVDHMASTETNKHVLRVGWSIEVVKDQLGEEPSSFGYGGTGKFSTNNIFTNYGKSFERGDVIGCFMDYSDEHLVKLSFTKNEEHLGLAHTINKDLNGAPLFPHILTKNVSYEVNFGQKESYFPTHDSSYCFISWAPKQCIFGPTVAVPSSKEDCEVIMMCGLPGSGKTYWAEKHTATNPHKNYRILGTNYIMEKMKVMGLKRKRNYHGRWDVLIKQATDCLNHLLTVANRQLRNYILDQTNVYPGAQRRKLGPFRDFRCRAVVIVPEEGEYQKRLTTRNINEGKVVPEEAILEMKANFALPDPKAGIWKSVEYAELKLEDAKMYVSRYNKEAIDKGILPSSMKTTNKAKRMDQPSTYGSSYNGQQQRDSKRHHDGLYTDQGVSNGQNPHFLNGLMEPPSKIFKGSNADFSGSAYTASYQPQSMRNDSFTSDYNYAVPYGSRTNSNAYYPSASSNNPTPQFYNSDGIPSSATEVQETGGEYYDKACQPDHRKMNSDYELQNYGSQSTFDHRMNASHSNNFTPYAGRYGPSTNSTFRGTQNITQYDSSPNTNYNNLNNLDYNKPITNPYGNTNFVNPTLRHLGSYDTDNYLSQPINYDRAPVGRDMSQRFPPRLPQNFSHINDRFGYNGPSFNSYEPNCNRANYSSTPPSNRYRNINSNYGN